MADNLLLFGDNLQGLQYLLDERKLYGQVDLVYIDPPFSTGTNFTITKERSSTISSSLDGEIAYRDTLKGTDFIEFLRKRLLLIKKLLSSKGSIYLHIDYKIGHYVKIMMDEVFGLNNFRNDITRVKCNPKNFQRIGYGNIKDMILFYTKASKPIWHEPVDHYTSEDIVRLFPKIDAKGRRYTTIPLHAPGETRKGQSMLPFNGIYPPKGRHWRTNIDQMIQWNEEGLIEWSENGVPRKIIYAEDRIGKRKQDIWDYKDPQYPVYPTEKNIDMLNSIIQTSSNEGSIVLDCFCGSGTTLEAAQLNGRKWIGIDESKIAINVVEKRMSNVKSNIFQNDGYEKISL